MRLGEKAKKLVMDNIKVIQHCNQIGVDPKKFKKCNIECMDGYYYFILSKENVPKSTSAVPLDIDIASQPDIVLIMDIDESGNYRFEETKKTKRILNI